MRCKLRKSNTDNSAPGIAARGRDECGCPACAEKERKEHQARVAEQKRRDDAQAAKYKAEQEARQRAYEAEQQRKREEAERKRREELAAKKRSEELRKKYADIANRNQVKLSDSKLSNEVEYIEAVKDFSHYSSRTYGLTFQDTVVVTFPYPAEVANVITYRLGKSNFFFISYLDKTHYISSHIIDMFGNKVTVAGNETFYHKFIEDPDKNSVTLFVKTSEFSQIGDGLVGGASVSTEMKFVSSMEGVNAHYQARLNSGFRGLGFGYKVYYASATAHVVDYSMIENEKATGILIQHDSQRPFN